MPNHDAAAATATAAAATTNFFHPFTNDLHFADSFFYQILSYRKILLPKTLGETLPVKSDFCRIRLKKKD